MGSSRRFQQHPTPSIYLGCALPILVLGIRIIKATSNPNFQVKVLVRLSPYRLWGVGRNCFNEPDFSSWRNLVYLEKFYAAGQLLDSVFHLKTVRVLSNLLISQDLGAFLNFLRKFFTKFIKQMKDLNVALQLCQAMVIYWAYLVSGFTEPLLFDDVLGTHHHVLSLWHPVHQSGRHRHRVLQGRHLGPPVQTEWKTINALQWSFLVS